MQVKTSPASRFLSEGQTVEYLVRADGATELRIGEQTLPGVEATVTDVRKTDAGIEARVSVELAESKFV